MGATGCFESLALTGSAGILAGSPAARGTVATFGSDVVLLGLRLFRAETCAGSKRVVFEGFVPGSDYRFRVFQSAFTRALVASSIKISSGHGRVNPSAAHLRVASMPIFEP
jgi:hypothetical protein